ncbi:glucose-6-phosphate dehydrogenase assembly protein OpcA [Nocardioides marmoribigeumensis]|uniref:Glucose-6-phosphate dehydrogenase assembly protein OpcA n=1 Tax=Nocardioides marmoribigeumensis TaxID=433649 RepID=A0ABU2C1P5_9ACTN|nr:glucose-6-phosphate dehydrogenase assembly protein OpcA [Nocardioides marmoribigeumensis]MDR7364494.1 glucose-6-phosphate dehydrogenase assembly protein OpcA [Nocardioides marmoribigeumensis]
MSTITLEDTSANAIASALVRARRNAGSPAMGMVMTLVVVVPEKDAEEAMKAAGSAAREHPSRILAVVVGSGRGSSRIDAEIRSGTGTPGELALIRLSGAVTGHAESVVLPLLLPDSPVVVWWPTDAPADPAADPIGRLAKRRITDAAQVPRGRQQAMLTQCSSYVDGNTDLAWTRITRWRALLAAALDQAPGRVTRIEITGERISPSADLLGAWLADRLKAPVERTVSDGPGITCVRLVTRTGEIAITRGDGVHATLTVPGQPDRPVALPRRDVPDLLSEELRRLDPDDIYAATAKRLHRMAGSTARKAAATKGTARKTTAKKAPASTKAAAGRTAKKAARKS